MRSSGGADACRLPTLAMRTCPYGTFADLAGTLRCSAERNGSCRVSELRRCAWVGLCFNAQGVDHARARWNSEGIQTRRLKLVHFVDCKHCTCAS